MKSIIIVMLSILVFGACKTKKQVTDVKPNIEVPAEVKYTAKNMVASIERTMCFGICPAYKMEIYGDGKIVYNGKAHVKNIGLFIGKTTTEKIDELLAKAKEIGYFDLEDAYDNKRITDLPSATTTILLNGVTKKILTRYSTPEKLIVFQKYFDNLFKDVVYTKSE